MNWLFTDLLVAFIILFVSFIVHEAAHILTARKLGYYTKAGFSNGSFEVLYWPKVTHADDIKVLNSGVFVGFAVSCLSIFLCVYWSPLVLILYVLGCSYDLKRLSVLYRHVGNRNI